MALNGFTVGLSIIVVCLTYVGADCVWYDECPLGYDKFNCLYQGPPRPLKNTTTLAILKQYCPSLAALGKEPDLCCSDHQLTTFAHNMEAPKQFLSSCPSCFQNFVNLFCYTSCHPNASDFMMVTETAPFLGKSELNSTKSVVSVNISVSSQFSYGMYNSCKDVKFGDYCFSGSDRKVIGLLCGTDANKCTPQKWLDFLGAGNNAPFRIMYNITDEVLEKVDYSGTTVKLTPLSETSFSCASAPSPSESACSCRDCRAACHKNQESGINDVHETHYEELVTPYYRIRQLVVRSNGSMWKPFMHDDPYPSADRHLVDGVFNKTFVKELLYLQNNITELTAVTRDKEKVTLQDICFKPHYPDNTNCSVNSVLQYFQNNGTNLDKVTYDSSGFFITADYIDHINSCCWCPNRTVDFTALKTSCLSDYGGPVSPHRIFGDYSGKRCTMATEHTMAFALNRYPDPNDPKRERLLVWEKKFNEFIGMYARKVASKNGIFITVK